MTKAESIELYKNLATIRIDINATVVSDIFEDSESRRFCMNLPANRARGIMIFKTSQGVLYGIAE